MKKWILLGFVLVLLVGCSEDNVSLWKREANEVQIVAKEDVITLKYVTEDSINEALDYLKQHIVDPLRTREIGKRMIYYSSYLWELGNKDNSTKDLEITKTSEVIHNYLVSLYTMKDLPNRLFIQTKGLEHYLRLIVIDKDDITRFVALYE